MAIAGGKERSFESIWGKMRFVRAKTQWILVQTPTTRHSNTVEISQRGKDTGNAGVECLSMKTINQLQVVMHTVTSYLTVGNGSALHGQQSSALCQTL